MKNLYETIGVSPGATQAEITSKSVELGRQLLPASERGDLRAAMRLKDIEAAYEILGNPEKRKQYDQQLGQGDHSKSSAGSAIGPAGTTPKRPLSWKVYALAAAVPFIAVPIFGAMGLVPSAKQEQATPEDRSADFSVSEELKKRVEFQSCEWKSRSIIACRVVGKPGNFVSARELTAYTSKWDAKTRTVIDMPNGVIVAPTIGPGPAEISVLMPDGAGSVRFR